MTTPARARTGLWPAVVEQAVLAAEGCRLLAASARRRRQGLGRWHGSPEEICEQIVRACFDGERRYFRTSLTSYPELWARDFGRCAPALLALGFEAEVADTYRYALGRYARAGRFALVVTPGGRLYDFPAYAPDGLAFFLDGLAALGDRALVAAHRGLLAREAARCAELVVDPATGLVRRGLRLSEAQDYAARDSSCYTNSVCHLLGRSLARLRLPNPFAAYDYPALIAARFWDGDHFLDDARRPTYPSGDAQIMPFRVGLCGRGGAARRRFDRVLAWMDRVGLNDPLPTRYGIGPHPQRRMHPLHRLDAWQGDTVWTCLGLQLLEVLHDLGHPRFGRELASYRALVARHGCFPELLDARTGDPYVGPFIMAEDSMLWAANLWHLMTAAPAAAEGDDA